MALAERAGQTVAAAAVPGAWESARHEVARLLGQGDPRKTEAAERWLAETHQQLTAAQGAGLEPARAAAARRWEGRFADLLDEVPEVEADLRAVVEEIAAQLPARMVSAAEPKPTGGRTDLFTVFSTQFNSYTSLLWQVPALALTAQSFLLTIALNSMSTRGTTIVTSALAVFIALASWSLMHDQRGLAISHGYFTKELAKEIQLGLVVPAEEDDAEPWLKELPNGKLSQAGLSDLSKRFIRRSKRFIRRLSFKKLIKGPAETDSQPTTAETDSQPTTAETDRQPITAENVWVVPSIIYHVWRTCLLAFMVANFGIFISASVNSMWWK